MEPAFVNYLAIGLTVVTVALGAVAVMVAVIAFYGYNSIKQEAIKVASREVGGEIEKQLGPKINELLESAGDGGQFDKAVKRAIADNLYGGPSEKEE